MPPVQSLTGSSGCICMRRDRPKVPHRGYSAAETLQFEVMFDVFDLDLDLENHELAEMERDPPPRQPAGRGGVR